MGWSLNDDHCRLKGAGLDESITLSISGIASRGESAFFVIPLKSKRIFGAIRLGGLCNDIIGLESVGLPDGVIELGSIAFVVYGRNLL